MVADVHSKSWPAREDSRRAVCCGSRRCQASDPASLGTVYHAGVMGVVSTLCLRRYGQVGDSGFSLGLGWDLHWLERGRNRVVDLHCWGPRSRANKQIKSFVRDWIRAGREGQAVAPKTSRGKALVASAAAVWGEAKNGVCVCVCGCVRESGLVWLVAL